MAAADLPIGAAHRLPRDEAHQLGQTGSRTGGDRRNAPIRAPLPALLRAPGAARAPDLEGPKPAAAAAKAPPGRAGPQPAAPAGPPRVASETGEPKSPPPPAAALPALDPASAAPPAEERSAIGPGIAAPLTDERPATGPGIAAPPAGGLPTSAPGRRPPHPAGEPPTIAQGRPPAPAEAVPPPARTDPPPVAGQTPGPANRAPTAGEGPDLPARGRLAAHGPRRGGPPDPGRPASAMLRTDRAAMTARGSTAPTSPAARTVTTRMGAQGAPGRTRTHAPLRPRPGPRPADVTTQRGASPPTAAAPVRAGRPAKPNGGPDPASTPSGAAWLAKAPAPCPTLHPAGRRPPSCGEKRHLGPDGVTFPKMVSGPRMRCGSRKPPATSP